MISKDLILHESLLIETFVDNLLSSFFTVIIFYHIMERISGISFQGIEKKNTGDELHFLTSNEKDYDIGKVTFFLIHRARHEKHLSLGRNLTRQEFVSIPASNYFLLLFCCHQDFMLFIIVKTGNFIWKKPSWNLLIFFLVAENDICGANQNLLIQSNAINFIVCYRWRK